MTEVAEGEMRVVPDDADMTGEEDGLSERT